MSDFVKMDREGAINELQNLSDIWRCNIDIKSVLVSDSTSEEDRNLKQSMERTILSIMKGYVQFKDNAEGKMFIHVKLLYPVTDKNIEEIVYTIPKFKVLKEVTRIMERKDPDHALVIARVSGQTTNVIDELTSSDMKIFTDVNLIFFS